MTIFMYVPLGLEQVWACISSLHLYCNYLEMIKARFLIGEDFLGFDIIKKLKKHHLRKHLPLPQCQNDAIKDKIDSRVFPDSCANHQFSILQI